MIKSKTVTTLLFLVSGLLQHVGAQKELKQLHVITRHGSRHPLQKHAMTLEENTETSFLTPLGQQQHFQLGKWLRDQYLESGFLRVLEEYSPDQVLLESSAYERTMASANALALGLFPSETRGLQVIPETPPNIPVYTFARRNDITIRPYDKCPVFLDSLEQLYNSQSWKEMEQDSMPLLRKLANHKAFAQYVAYDNVEHYIPLKEIWNVFDEINVAKTECLQDSPLCSDLPFPELGSSISEEDWDAIQDLSHAVERIRYGPDVAKNYLAGTFLNKMVQRMQWTDSTDTTVPSDFFLTSGHYPTLLGIFSALNVPLETHYLSGQDAAIPEYASAVIFEVYRDRSNYERSVRIWYKPGSSTQPTAIRLSDNCATDEEDGCPMDTFLKLLNKVVLTPQEWCSACQNTGVDVCLQLNSDTIAAQAQSCSSRQSNNILAALFFCGMMTMGIFIFLKSFCTLGRRGCVGDSANMNENMTTDGNVVKLDPRESSSDGEFA